MKKAVLFYTLFVFSFLIIVPQVYAGHVPEILFAKKVRYTYTPHGGTSTTVDALDINGKYLQISHHGRMPIPVVKLGITGLTVLLIVDISGTDKQQLVVQLPSSILSGSYQISVDNDQHVSYFGVTFGAVGPVGPQGVQGRTGTNGIHGLAGTAGTNGIDGADGARGPIGISGTNGVDGADGSNGTNGNNGVDGQTGSIGLTGPAGNTSTKAWVNFNGVGTPTIRGHSGISSIVREGAGEYRINFSTPFANTNYVMSESASNGIVFIRNVDASFITIYLLDTAGRLVNGTWIMLEFTSN